MLDLTYLIIPPDSYTDLAEIDVYIMVDTIVMYKHVYMHNRTSGMARTGTYLKTRVFAIGACWLTCKTFCSAHAMRVGLD